MVLNGSLDSQVAYWKERFAELPAVPELPADRPRVAAASRDVARHAHAFDRALVEALRSLAKREGASLRSIFHAALSVLIARLSGEKDVVFGTPVEGSGSEQGTEASGSVVPFRVNLSDTPTFRETLRRSHAALGELEGRGGVAFERAAEGISLPSLERVLLDLRRAPRMAGDALAVEMALRVDEDDPSLATTVSYRTALFGAERIAEVAAQLELVLRAMSSDVESSVDACSLITARARTLVPDPTIALDVPAQELVTRTVGRWAADARDHAAFEGFGARWTYAELVARTAAIRDAILARDVPKGARVVVTGARSPGLVAALFAVFDAGAVAVAVPDRLPEARKRLMATEADAALTIVVGPRTEGDGLGLPAMRVDPTTGGVLEEGVAKAGRAVPEIDGDDPMYVIFTSGSTGIPKGVLGRHKGPAHYFRWLRETFSIGPDDRTSQLTGLAYGAIKRDLFMPMTAGATLCFPPSPAELLDGKALLSWLREARVTVIPSVVSSMLETWFAQAPDAPPVPDIRLVILTGEPVNDTLVRQCRRYFPNARIVVIYGQVETTLTKTFYDVPAEPMLGTQPVGRPLPQTQTLVLNAAGVPCGLGEPGEIVIRTPFRTLGYLKGESREPGVPSAPFRRNPFRDDPSDLVYHTGDLGRYLLDGQLQMIGRLDDQVKIGGARVQPGEVGAALRRHSSVVSAFVAVFTNLGRPALCAYVVLTPGTSIDADDLRKHLTAHLPLAFIPATFVFLEKMPLTTSGKVDRKALPAPDVNAVPSAPRTRARLSGDVDEFTEWLIKRFAELVGVDATQIDLRTPFASYGVTSLHAVTLARDIAERLRRDVPTTILFEHANLARLRAALDGSAPAEAPKPVAQPAPASGLIAIVGMGCRVPGSATLAEFWQMLTNGVDAVGPVPPGREYMREEVERAGFIKNVELFDNECFHISAREAHAMDPRQRHVLEVAWEALEDAGLPIDKLAGTQTGVFVGAGVGDWEHVITRRGAGSVDTYFSSGRSVSVIANRISYAFELNGPSITIDGACSASLVAVHLACQSLLSGESTIAIAGGVQMMLSTAVHVGLRLAGMGSPDASCKAFDARANGYVRGEGASMVVLKTYEQAVADGDRIYAVVLGSAVNHCGRPSGLSVPSERAQEAVIRSAYARAGVDPDRAIYIEAHATGTPLGDPIEMRALANVFAKGRSHEKPLRVGSAKTNIGHLEAAAGITGLIKLALSLHHRRVPPSLHFVTPNPEIPFAQIPIEVQTKLEDFANIGGRPGETIASVSSFGFGGTNSHVVLRDVVAPVSATREAAVTGPVVLPLSANTRRALVALSQAYEKKLESDAPALRDLAWTAGTRRGHFEDRVAVVADSLEELRASLSAFIQRGAGVGVYTGNARRDAHSMRGGPKVAFVFSGQGSQWAGMGQELLGHAVFRRKLEECDRIILAHAGWSLSELLASRDARLAETEFAQPALVAIQLALAALWMSWGIKPAAVTGHSLGEISAACVAGILAPEDALRFAVDRGRIMQRLTGLGAMAEFRMTATEANDLLAGFEDRVSIAGLNAPKATILSGEREALKEIIRIAAEKGITARDLPVNFAFHSPQVAALREELAQKAGGLRLRTPEIPVVSTLTSDVHETFDGPYWADQMRSPVRFQEAATRLLSAGCNVLLEIGPHPSLGRYMRDIQDAAKLSANVLASMQRADEEGPKPRVIIESLGALYARGCDVDWTSVYPDGQRVPVPQRVWQHKPFLFGDLPVWDPAAARDGRSDAAVSPPRVVPAVVAPRVSKEPPPVPVEASVHDQQDRARTPVEERIATVWCEVLEVDKVGIHDNFFELGGHSLLATQVMHRLSRAFDLKLPLRLVFEASTVAELAERVAAMQPVKAVAPPAKVSVAPPAAASVDPHALQDNARTPLEQRVVAVWREVLELEEVGIHDNFFELGGHSLLATQVMHRLSRAFDLKLPLRLVFEASTVAELAERIAALQPAKPAAAAAPPPAPVVAVAAVDPHAQQDAPRTPIEQRIANVWREVLEIEQVGIFDNFFELGGHSLLATQVMHRLSRAFDLKLPLRLVFEASTVAELGQRVGELLPASVAAPPKPIPAPAVAAPAHDPHAQQDAPRTDLEKRVASVWCEVLEVEQVGIFDNFFELGGHSLLATQVMHRLGRAFDLKLPLRLVFEASTVAELGQRISELLPAKATPAASPPPVIAATASVVDPHAQDDGPRSDLEKRVASVWREVLEVEQVGIFDNFFELGGHSLLATQVMHRLGRAFDVKLPLRMVFEASTIAELGQRIGELLPAPKGPAALSAPKVSIIEDAPAVDPHAQQDAPRTELEKGIATVWCEVLEVEHVGIFDNFFELGGHSLLATQVMHRLGRTFDVKLPLRLVFEAATVAELAQRVGEVLPAPVALSPKPVVVAPKPVAPAPKPIVAAFESDSDDVPLVPVDRGGRLRASFAQERFWGLEQSNPGTSAQHVASRFWCTGPLDVALVEKSLTALVKRHEGLRTTFSRSADGLFQEIHPARGFKLPVVDVSGEADPKKEALRCSVLEVRRPFDMAQGPLFRATLFRVGPQEHLFAIVAHHTVWDAWSNIVFLRDLEAFAVAFARGAAPPLEDLAFQPADHAAWERGRLAGPVLEEQLAFWAKQLAGAPVLDLPTDRPRGTGAASIPTRHEFRIPANVVSALNALSRREGVTLYMTLLASYATLLCQYSGQTEVVIGTPTGLRGRPELERMIAPLSNAVPMRVSVAGEPTVRELLHRARSSALATSSYQEAPIRQIEERLRKANPASKLAFDALLAVNTFPRPNLRLPGVETRQVPLDIPSVDIDLALLCEAAGDELAGAFHYNAALYDVSTIDGMAAHLIALLEGMGGS